MVNGVARLTRLVKVCRNRSGLDELNGDSGWNDDARQSVRVAGVLSLKCTALCISYIQLNLQSYNLNYHLYVVLLWLQRKYI